ncbi:MAG: DUF2384 domain-containing protein [Methylococcaceae bacterium]|nr:MAG: DUF2384 domain-containing protein [Methylococcaceae bacterium]
MATIASAALHFHPSAEILLGSDTRPSPTPRSPFDWVSSIRQGISTASVDAIIGYIHLSRAELALVLGIPERTLARRRREGVLNSEESAKLVRLARVVERAVEVFDDLDAAIDWLKSANAAFSGATPLSLLDTDVGAESVLDALGRIEHGVFA